MLNPSFPRQEPCANLKGANLGNAVLCIVSFLLVVNYEAFFKFITEMKVVQYKTKFTLHSLPYTFLYTVVKMYTNKNPEKFKFWARQRSKRRGCF